MALRAIKIHFTLMLLTIKHIIIIVIIDVTNNNNRCMHNLYISTYWLLLGTSHEVCQNVPDTPLEESDSKFA